MKRILAVAVAVIFLSAVARGQDKPAQDRHHTEAELLPKGQIAFIKREIIINGGSGSQGGCIYVINADGSNLKKIGPAGKNVSYAAWSRDRSKIAIQCCDGAYTPNAIYTINADGSNLKFINHGVFTSWFPDGNKLVYFSKPGIYVSNADGTDTKKITDDIDHHFMTCYGLALSPDGKKIIFSTERFEDKSGSKYDCINSVWIMDADGSNKKNLSVEADGNGRAYSFSWSPDSKKIAFEDRVIYRNQSRRFTDAIIWIMDTDGSNKKKLVDEADEGSVLKKPLWSPDGRKIASWGNGCINVINVDGSDLKKLTDTNEWMFPILWSPDSEKLAFVNKSDNYNFDIYTINADGSNVKILTTCRLGGLCAWLPAK